MKPIQCFNRNCSMYNVCERTMQENSRACEGFKEMYTKSPEKAVKIQRASYDEIANMLAERFGFNKN